MNVLWCGCLGIARRRQLLRAKLFPASIDRPNTVMTFNALEFHHLLTVQAKTTLYDFYETLLKRQDNSGLGKHFVRVISSILTFTIPIESHRIDIGSALGSSENGVF